MPNVKLVLEYDGADFSGFQRQPGRRTVQGELERALEAMLGVPRGVVAAGRTDAGVHAIGQVVSFAVENFPVDRICSALNDLLPRSIRAVFAEQVPPEFHARYSAKARTYVYVILNRQVQSALLQRYVWQIRFPLDVEAMRLASRKLIGVQDFASFGLAGSARESTVREVTDLKISRSKDRIFFVIRANAFLHGMVRSIVGTLVEVGRGIRAPEEIAEVLRLCDRSAAGKSAPPQGLYLVSVEY